MTVTPVVAAIGLGSNLGDRGEHLDRAVREIARTTRVRVVSVSSWIETDPVGGPSDQGRFLNGALLLETSLSARELLAELQRIERAHGRDRSQGVFHGPRTLDLDLLLHGDEIHDEPGLCVPHPRMAEREFVLEPLAQIAPDLRFPSPPQSKSRIEPGGPGGASVRERLAELRARRSAAREGSARA